MQRVFFSLEHRWLIRGAQVQRIFSQEAWLLNKATWQQENTHRFSKLISFPGIAVECTKSGGAWGEQFNPLPLMSKGEKWKTYCHTYCHQCQRGRLLEIWLKQKMTQMVKVVIDGNLDCLWKTEAGTQKLEHRCCNTNANYCNTNANTDAETQCWNRVGTQKLTQMVKVVIDDNRLVMKHAQSVRT